MTKRSFVSMILVALVLVSLTGCGNYPPVISGVTASPNPVDPNQTTSINCTVEDQDDNVNDLSFAWYSPYGDTTYTAQSFNWKAPATEGNYSFYLSVKDSKGGVAYDTLVVQVAYSGIPGVTVFPATAIGTRQATILWTSAAPSWYEYQLFRADRSDVQTYGKIVATIGYDQGKTRLDTSYVDTDLQPGQTYYYAVLVVDSSDNEAWSTNEIPVQTESFNLVGSQPLGGGHGVRLVNNGNYIFCAAREQAVKGFTITSQGPNPAAVIRQPNNDLTAWAYDLGISNNMMLHVAFGRQGYAFYDITNPQAPDSLGIVDTAALFGEARAIYAEGDNVFIGSASSSGLYILHWYSVPAPAGPAVLMDTALLHDEPTDIYVSGNFVYVAVQNGGVETISWSQATATISFTSLTSTNDAANRIYVHSSYAYVAASSEGMMILDLSSPGNPVYGGQWPEKPTGDNNAQGIYYSNGRAYLADGEYGLRLLDISKVGDPLNPVLEATKDLSDVVGNYRLMDVWVTNQAGGKTQAILADWFNAIHMIEW